MSQPTYRLSARAKRELKATLNWSITHFGIAAARRYKHLLFTAFEKIAANPNLLNAQSLEEFQLYHIRHCRKQAVLDGQTVNAPRHFIVYRVKDGIIEISRILHDEMNIEDHLGGKE